MAMVVVCFGAVLMTAVARVGARMVEVHRAQAVADVSALGGAAGGAVAVAQISAANDARVLEVEVRSDGALDVTIAVGGAVASAAAVPG
jgi:hypothetical protein